jgi:hypothetical protein
VFILKKKIFSPKTGWPISIKLDCTKYPWVTGFQNCLNKGPGPIQRVDSYKNAKTEWVI